MSTDIAKRDEKPGNLQAWAHQPEIYDRMNAAVGDWMSVDTFMAHVMVTFQEPEVSVCTEGSKCRAIMELAALTLLPTLGQVALVPYNNKYKKKDGTEYWQKEIKVTPQWQGFKALMERHPSILEVTGVLVHNADDFCILNGEMRHSFDPFDPERNISGHSAIKGGYCKIIYSDGRPPKYHFVPVRHIKKASQCAQTQKIWNAWYEQMAMKTLYRDTFARRAVPLDPLVAVKLKQACDIEDVNLGNDPARVTSEATEKHIEQAQQQRIEAAVEDLPPNDTVIDEPSPEPESQVEPEPDDDLEMELHALIGEYRDQANEKTALKHLDALATDAKGNEKFTTNGKLGTAAMVSALAKISEAKDRLRSK